MKIYAIKDKKNGMLYSTFRKKENAEKHLEKISERKPWVYDVVKIVELEENNKED